MSTPQNWLRELAEHHAPDPRAEDPVTADDLVAFGRDLLARVEQHLPPLLSYEDADAQSDWPSGFMEGQAAYHKRVADWLKTQQGKG